MMRMKSRLAVVLALTVLPFAGGAEELADPQQDSPIAEVTAQLVEQAITVRPSPAVAPAPGSAPPVVMATPVIPAFAQGGELTVEQLLPVLASSAASGQWLLFALALLLGAVLVFLTVAGIRAFVGKYIPALLTDRAGVLLSWGVGALGSLVTALSLGQPITLGLLIGIFSSLIASGTKSWQTKGLRPAQPICTPEDYANETEGCAVAPPGGNQR